mgnify:CR=1 FL=1
MKRVPTQTAVAPYAKAAASPLPVAEPSAPPLGEPATSVPL